MKFSVIDDERVNDSKGGFLSHVDDWCEASSLSEFAEILTLTHIAPGVFKDNRKRQDHLEQIEFVCFDFDDGQISSFDVHTKLKFQYNHVIAASKNCFKDKGDGKGEIERFHLFIPTDTPITSVELYKYICNKVAKLASWNVDRNCQEPARYFYKHPMVLTIHERAKALDVARFVKMKSLEDELEADTQRRAAKFFDTNDTTPPVEQFKRTKYYRMMTDGLLRQDGQRYAVSCQIIGAMLKVGLQSYEGMALFDEYSIYGTGFTRKSIESRFNKFTKG